MTSEERDDDNQPQQDTSTGDSVATVTPEGEAAAPEGEGKLKQTVEITDAGPCRKHVKVTVERVDIDERFEHHYKEIAKSDTTALRGFRPGKAPRKIIERRYLKEVSEQVKTEVLMASLQQLADEANLSPLTAPDINPDKIPLPEEGPLVYEFEVEVRPEFDLPPYKGIKLRRPVHKFTDAEISREKRRILEEDGQLVPKENGIAELDDTVVADITVKFRDQTINELKEVRFRVDKKLALADGVADKFDKQMVGAKIGEKRVIPIKLSDSLPNSVLRTQTVQAEFDVKDIKTYRLPELTEEMLTDFGVSSEAQLDELIHAALERRLEYTQRQEARRQILEIINDTAQLDIPRDMLKRQSQRTLVRRVMEMRNAGIPEEQIRGRMAVMQQDELRNTALLLKEHFVLQKIAEVEKIEIGDEDIDAEIERLAEQNDESPRKLRARLEKDDMIESLAADLLERKSLDLVLAEATYDDYELNTDDSEPQIASADASAVPESQHDKPEEEPTAPTGETPANP